MIAILAKIINIILIIFLIYIWNKYVVTYIVKSVNGFHKRNNVVNLTRQPIKFAIENELTIIRFAQGFYWIGGSIIIIGILFY